MAGKGSRQRTFGTTYEDNYEQIFGVKANGEEARASLKDTVSKGATRPSVDADGNGLPVDQYPIEAREMAKKGLWEA
jgi:hypothetical protein